MAEIHLNFLEFENQDFGITVYRKKNNTDQFLKGFDYYDFKDENGNNTKYQISYILLDGFETYKLPPYAKTGIISKALYDQLKDASNGLEWFIKKESEYNRRIHFTISKHAKGRKCIWIEPFFLKSKNTWGLLFDYCFVVDSNIYGEAKFKIDKDILIASGTMNERGGSNVDYYLFKHRYLQAFIKSQIKVINTKFDHTISDKLILIQSKQLNTKTYVFGNGMISNSSYQGLSKYQPLESVKEAVQYYFLYKKIDREIAVALLKGLRGELSPTTFSGMNKLFKIDFSNSMIKGSAIEDFSDKTISDEILKIKKLGNNVSRPGKCGKCLTK